MTLEEAIEHCESISCENSKCGIEHKQLAGWLNELKKRRKQERPEVDLEKEFQEYWYLHQYDHRLREQVEDGFGKGVLKNTARYFYELGREVKEHPALPSNLDEAANNYGIDIRLGYPRVMDETDRYIYNAFKARAEWMAGQFQKIDGELVDWYETNGVDYCHGINTNESLEVPEGFYIRKKQ